MNECYSLNCKYFFTCMLFSKDCFLDPFESLRSDNTPTINWTIFGIANLILALVLLVSDVIHLALHVSYVLMHVLDLAVFVLHFGLRLGQLKLELSDSLFVFSELQEIRET